MNESVTKPRFGTVRWTAETLQRLAQRWGSRIAIVGFVVKQLNHFTTGADIAWNAKIGKDLALPHPTGVVVGQNVVIGDDCVLQSCVTLGGVRSHDDRQPVLGARVAVGAGARILGPVVVGDDVVIGANSVVTRDIPSGATAVGVPARIV